MILFNVVVDCADCSNQIIINRHVNKYGLESCDRLFGKLCCLKIFMNDEVNQTNIVNLNNKQILSNTTLNGEHWQGVNPDLWNQRFPNDCSRSSQSPINIQTDETIYDNNLKDFIFENFDLKLLWKVDFDGYSGIYK